MSVVNRLFAGVGDIEITRLAAAEGSKDLTFATGQVVLEQGQPGDSLFLIKTGAVQVALAVDGQAPLELAVLRSGDFFGEAALFGPGPRGATVKALQHTVLLEIPAEPLRELMARHPALELSLLRTHTERLRRSSDEILAFKLREAPEAVRLLEARLSAEVRVFDATLKAAHAVFEQTKIRSDEVITNAERTRSRFTYVGSTIATVFTLAGMALGGLGLRDVWSLKSLQQDSVEAVKAAERFKTDSANLEKEIRGQIDAINKVAAQAREILIRDQVVPALREALAEGAPLKASAYFEQLAELGWANEENVAMLLYQVEDALVATRDPSGAVTRARLPADASRQDFTDLLNLMAARVQSPETQAKAYSLIVANSILVDKPDQQEKALSSFRGLLARHKDERLLSRETWKALDDRLGQAGQHKREAFQQVRRSMPTGG
jgi:CRP-like cAMP-binding protein